MRVRDADDVRVERADELSAGRREAREPEVVRLAEDDPWERAEEPSDLDPRKEADRGSALALDREEDREEDLNEDALVRLALSTVRRVGRLRSTI